MNVMNDCPQFSTLEVEGTLRAPLSAALRRSVEALLRRGHHCILLNLARLSDIDAAGIGELLHAYERTRAAGGVLRISHASRHVRRLLDVTEISRVLDEEPDHSQVA
jgi:anti-anti-sigma factor